MISFVWQVTNMSILPNVPNLPDYVVLVNGTVTGSNDANPPVTAFQFFNVQLVVDDDQEDYIPYEDLTEEQVIEWVQEVLTPTGVSNLEINITNQIDSIVNPPVVPIPQPLPWQG